MPVCSSSSGTREESESIITVTSPKYQSTDGSFGDEDSLESAENDHNEVKSLMFPAHVSDLCQLCFFNIHAATFLFHNAGLGPVFSYEV